MDGLWLGSGVTKGLRGSLDRVWMGPFLTTQGNRTGNLGDKEAE